MLPSPNGRVRRFGFFSLFAVLVLPSATSPISAAARVTLPILVGAEDEFGSISRLIYRSTRNRYVFTATVLANSAGIGVDVGVITVHRALTSAALLPLKSIRLARLADNVGHANGRILAFENTSVSMQGGGAIADVIHMTRATMMNITEAMIDYRQ